MYYCKNKRHCHQDNNKILKLNSMQTQVQRQIILISYVPMQKTIFGEYDLYSTHRRISNGKTEGQLGGMLARPKNF
jgi:hypothetical protein